MAVPVTDCTVSSRNSNKVADFDRVHVVSLSFHVKVPLALEELGSLFMYHMQSLFLPAFMILIRTQEGRTGHSAAGEGEGSTRGEGQQATSSPVL